MIFAVSHTRRVEDKKPTTTTRIHRELVLGFDSHASTVEKPLPPKQPQQQPTRNKRKGGGDADAVRRLLLLDDAGPASAAGLMDAVHARLESASLQRRRELEEMRRSLHRLKTVQGPSSMPPPPRTPPSAARSPLQSHASPRRTPPSSSSHRSTTSSGKRRGMDERDELRALPSRSPSPPPSASSSSALLLRRSPSPTSSPTTGLLAAAADMTSSPPLDANSSSVLLNSSNSDVDDQDSRDFCRARRINSLGGRREQILIILDTVPAARDKYLKELAEVDAMLYELVHQPSSVSPFKLISSHSTSSSKREEEEEEAEPSFLREEEEEAVAVAAHAPLPPPPPPPPLLVTFDWTAFSKAYVSRVLHHVDVSQLLLVSSASDVFEQVEDELYSSIDADVKEERRAVFSSLNQVWRERGDAPLPSVINDFVAELVHSLLLLRHRGERFPTMLDWEVEDYVLRHVVRVQPSRFYSTEDDEEDEGPFLLEDFARIEDELKQCGREQRQLVFDNLVEVLRELFPGGSAATSIRDFVRQQRRVPQNVGELKKQVLERMFDFAPLAFWGASLTAADATVIAQNLARQQLAREEREEFGS